MMRPLFLSLVVVAGLALPGCLERRLSITSEPPGALVWVNDVELGRTPVEADFTFYGEYDVRISLEGYEPIHKQMTAPQPIQEYPPFDLVAGALPVDFENVVKWHFDLQPALEKSEDSKAFENNLMDRARGLRERLESDKPAPAEAKPEEIKPADPKPEDITPAEPAPTEPAPK